MVTVELKMSKLPRGSHYNLSEYKQTVVKRS